MTHSDEKRMKFPSQTERKGSKITKDLLKISTRA